MNITIPTAVNILLHNRVTNLVGCLPLLLSSFFPYFSSHTKIPTTAMQLSTKMMFYPTPIIAKEENTVVPVGTTIMGHRAPKQMRKTRTTVRSGGRVMVLVTSLMLLLLVAEGAVVMPEEEEGAWSDAGIATHSTATTAAEEEGAPRHAVAAAATTQR